MGNIPEVFRKLRNPSFYILSGFTTAILAIHPVQAFTITKVDLLGQSTFPTGSTFQGTELGGLSGITYDASKNIYYSISDDRSEKAPARFYTLNIDLSQGSLQQGGVIPVGVTTLLTENGQPFAPLSLDPEGITLTSKGTVFVSSEGDASKLVAPFVKEFSLNGEQLNTLPVRDKFLPTATSDRGIRNNLAFESLTITPDQKSLFTATENAIAQDGPAAALGVSSPSRILKYNLGTGKAEQEFLYLTEPVAAAANPAGTFSTNGLVDLLALDNNGNFLSLERSFSKGVGNTIKLFEVSLDNADDISAIDSLSTVNLNTIKPADKKLLLDFATLNLPLDNIEGLTFGPNLADGRRSLIVVSDNNFSPTQFTQVLAFGIESSSTREVPEPSALAGLALITLVGIKVKHRAKA
ncbi:esterase-like activity of phytase family protein [Microcoleus sp. FACHB-831]|uniref:esterase-like activity of phytase family protein n=1 Tax=Microcoleus sp. FACHB-831 TaxID=2692827 RepID=UPI0016896DE0|nr:esterase-like activity of phytase family protein [Microcoleus sp. FACHB-831]MBD1922849.1 esterase-like activity of phytase family protein [Microcoleus sp. FACHB-831]